MIDPTCEQCQKTTLASSFNPCWTSDGTLNCGCECHKSIEERLKEYCPPSFINDLVELLVDTTIYGVAGVHWCRWAYTAPGSAAMFPYKVHIPERGIGQYKASEIKNVREWGSEEVKAILRNSRERLESRKLRT